MTFFEWLTQPKYTKLEQELAKEVDYLRAQLESERRKTIETLEKLAFPNAVQALIQPQSFSPIPPPESAIQAQAKKLSSLSRQRLDAQIAMMEHQAKVKVEKDEQMSRRANEESSENIA